jgi:hypothetical protein
MIQYKRKNKDQHTCLKAMTQFFTLQMEAFQDQMSKQNELIAQKD